MTSFYNNLLNSTNSTILTSYPNVYTVHAIRLFLQYKSVLMIDFSNVDKQVLFSLGLIIYELLLKRLSSKYSNYEAGKYAVVIIKGLTIV